jgi:acyltransferase
MFSLILKKLLDYAMYLQIIVFFIFGTVGIVIGSYIHLPWSIDIALVTQPLLFVGYKLRETKFFEKTLSFTNMLTISIVILFFVSINFNSIVDMNNRLYGHTLFFYVGGITGSIIVIKLCGYLIRYKRISQLLKYIGKESLPILTLHNQATI